MITLSIFSRNIFFIFAAGNTNFFFSADLYRYYTIKQRGVLPNPQKRFRRFLKAFKEAQSLLKKGFVGEGSSPGYTGRTFKGSVDFFIRFLRLWAPLDAFRNLRNLFQGFSRIALFLQCSTPDKSLRQS